MTAGVDCVTLTVESAFPDTRIFFLSIIPLVRDSCPVREEGGLVEGG